MMFQLLKWCWIAGASDSASGRKIKREVWIVGVFMTSLLQRGRVCLFLALGAPEGGTAVLNEAPHDAAATRGLAFLAFAVVDLKPVLEIAELARGLAMIADRGAAGLDRLIQDVVDRAHQTFGVIGGLGLLGRQRRRQAPRRQMRAIKRFADIDVAKSRHHALVEQG